MTVSSALIAPQADRPLTPAMVRVVWQIAAELDRARVPAAVDQAVWVQLATAEVRGDAGRDDNGWLRQAMRRLSGVTLSGETRNGKWGAVLVAQWEIVSGGSVMRILVPPAAVAAMRAPETFAKLDTEAHPDAGARHQIRSIPTLALFKGGRELDRVSGALPAPQLRAWLARHGL